MAQVMLDCLNRAEALNKSVDGVSNAECIAVLMYTDDGSAKAFYKDFNAATKTKSWKEYITFTTLLVSAIQKLAILHSIPLDATLYRGLHADFERPN